MRGSSVVTIYALVEPRSGQPRYIGQTIRKVRQRLNQHLSDSRRNTTPHVNAWLRGLASIGVTPEIWVIEEHSTHESGNEAEVFWIGMLRSWGFDLLNMASGGEGRRDWKHSDETKRKMRETHLKMPAPTHLHTPEVAARMGASMANRWAVTRHPRLGILHTEETIVKIRANRSLNPPKLSPEGREAIRAACIKRWQDPAYRAAWSAMMTKPNSRASQRAAPRAEKSVIEPTEQQ